MKKNCCFRVKGIKRKLHKLSKITRNHLFVLIDVSLWFFFSNNKCFLGPHCAIFPNCQKSTDNQNLGSKKSLIFLISWLMVLILICRPKALLLFNSPSLNYVLKVLVLILVMDKFLPRNLSNCDQFFLTTKVK